MTSTLIIKDLTLDKALDSKSMAAVSGGFLDQANATQQGNSVGVSAAVSVGNLANFAGSGPVTFEVTSQPSAHASNDSRNSNKIGSYYYWG